MSDKSGTSSQIISLPKGGGALQGIGEKFSPDLFTGTGNFTVPIALPPGRNGFQPQLNLVYSTGSGNGPFGLGWSLSIPGVGRKTSKGIPRTDGLFARIVHQHSAQDNYWSVHSKDGLVSRYGTPRPNPTPPSWSDPAIVRDHGALDRQRIFGWKLTETRDPFGNLIQYDYMPDAGKADAHEWSQPLLKQARYADYTDQNQ